MSLRSSDGYAIHIGDEVVYGGEADAFVVELYPEENAVGIEIEEGYEIVSPEELSYEATEGDR
jgi:hypothetical protein